MNPETPWLNQLVFQRTVEAWLAAAGILIAILLGWRILRSIVVRRSFRLPTPAGEEVEALAVQLVTRTRFLIVLVIALYAASFVLDLPEARTRLIRTLAVVALLVQGALWGNHLITFWLTRYLKRRRADDATSRTTLSTLGFVVRTALWATLLLLGLDNIGIKVTGLITGLGIGGVAVALAAQEVLKDLFASLAIALDKPFLIGDGITVADFSGTVEHIGIKTTRLRSTTGEEVIFSNSDILNSRIRNYQRLRERRSVFQLRVSYDTPVEKVAAIPSLLSTIVAAQRSVTLERAHLVSLGESAMLFEVSLLFHTPSFIEFVDAQQEINLAVLRRFRDEGIRIGLPAEVVHLRRPARRDHAQNG